MGILQTSKHSSSLHNQVKHEILTTR